MILLDTDILSHLFYAHSTVVRRRAAVPATMPVRISLATKIEVLRGRLEAVLKAANVVELMTAQLRFVQSWEFLKVFEPCVLFDDRAAQQFFALRADKRLRKTGRVDLMNAAIALVHNATLVTRNVKDFAAVPQLTLENWAD